MGMYAGLRGRVVLNELGQAVAVNEFDWSLSGNTVVAEFGNFSRSDFIPFGAHSYMPDSCGENRSTVADGIWEFSCSLKNYDGTIEKFIDEVLPLIGESWSLEKLYEEEDEPTAIRSEAQS